MRKPAVPVSTNGTQSRRSCKTRGITLIMYQELGVRLPPGLPLRLNRGFMKIQVRRITLFFFLV